jgi:hypothetical protein
MKKNAYADTTIKATAKRLKHLERNCNLDRPEQIKGFIATKECSNAYKETLTEAYDQYCQANEIVWNKPFYRRYDKLPKNLLSIQITQMFKPLFGLKSVHNKNARTKGQVCSKVNSLSLFYLPNQKNAKIKKKMGLNKKRKQGSLTVQSFYSRYVSTF